MILSVTEIGEQIAALECDLEKNVRLSNALRDVVKVLQPRTLADVGWGLAMASAAVGDVVVLNDIPTNAAAELNKLEAQLLAAAFIVAQAAGIEQTGPFWQQLEGQRAF